MSAPHTLHLIDASAFIFRAYYALKNGPRDPEGRLVNAVYGFTSFLLRYLDDEEPSHVAVAFDESLTTSFRNEMYPDYKANREAPPAELKEQFADCRASASALGFAVFSSDRYEADDLIGALASRFTAKGHRAVVVSPDKDLCQLVGDQVSLYDHAGKAWYGPKEVFKKFGVFPPQVPDYLGLVGDSVDNIPGVPGVGPKTASVLLGCWPSLEEVYANLDAVPDLQVRGAAALQGRLDEHRDQAFLSRTLATLELDAPVEADLRTLAYRGADRGQTEDLFERLGFGRIGGRIRLWRQGAASR